MVESPFSVVERLADQRVTLLLKDGRELDGQLRGSDDHLNLVLEDASERSEDVTRHLGRLVVRGSNVVAVYAPTAPHPKAR